MGRGGRGREGRERVGCFPKTTANPHSLHPVLCHAVLRWGLGPYAAKKKQLIAEGKLDKYGRPNENTPAGETGGCLHYPARAGGGVEVVRGAHMPQ